LWLAELIYNHRKGNKKIAEVLKMKVEFSDTIYRFECGKAPKGRGGWGFSFEGYEFWAQGTLTEAKKACMAYVREVAPKDYTGTVVVDILP
jgi:hypothetical protein